MKLVLPDGRELPLKNQRTARLDAVIELQLQGGDAVSAANIDANAKAAPAFAIAVLYFLTLWSAGDRVKWTEVMGLSLVDLGQVVPEPGDPGYVEPGTGDAVDPTEPTAEDAPSAPPAKRKRKTAASPS